MSLCQRGPGGKPARNERILVVDDDAGVTECVQCLLQLSGYKAVFADTGESGVNKARTEQFDLVITDMRLPGISGLEVIEAVKQVDRELPVILMTSFSSMESAVEALRKGATDYIIKPFKNDDFLYAVERAIDEQRMRRENAVLKRSLKKVLTGNRIIGESEGVKRVLALIDRVAATDANVLIHGESGTGKELVAQAIHFEGGRADGPFVPVNCGAIPSELLESELFGHTKGAFTGATSASEGLIREASGGTLFLDEISELPLALQVKLLRVIQERQVRPLGSAHSFVTDTRFVAASNRDLHREVQQGTFRADLYYRLNVISIHVPPLRERGKDIDLLARHFLEQHSAKLRKQIRMGPDLVEFLNSYHWPGNVRELENLIERAVILADSDVVTCADLWDMMQPPSCEPALAEPEGRPLSIEEYMKEFVKRHQHQHTEIELAAMLGIGRKALWMRRRRWGLYRDGPEGHDGGGRERQDETA